MAKAFLITPFSPESAGGELPEVFDAVQRIVAETLRRRGIGLVHPQRMTEGGFIIGQIESEIHSSDLVLAILTGRNPNCAHEIALAIAARRPLLLIAHSSKDLYFDVRHLRCLTYGGVGELDMLATRLDEGIASTVPDLSTTQQPRQITRSTPSLLYDGITAFIGPTSRGPLAATRISSWAEFTNIFGRPLPSSRSFLGYAVRGFFENGGTDAWIARVAGRGAACACADLSVGDRMQSIRARARSLGGWGNRIGLRLGPGTRTGIRLTVGIFDAADRQSAPLDDARIPANCEDYDNLGLKSAEPNHIIDVVNERSELIEVECVPAGPLLDRGDGVLVFLAGGSDGAPLGSDDYLGTGPPTGLRILEEIDGIASVCIPDHVHPALPPEDKRQIEQTLIGYCERVGDRITILATASGIDNLTLLKPAHDTGFAAAYFPWLRVPDDDGPASSLVPPIGHIAGLIGRNDHVAGVHFAPIDLRLFGTIAGQGDTISPLECAVGMRDRDTLRRLGINAIYLDGTDSKPIVSTALTLAIDETLQPLNGRRLANYIHRSLRQGLSWTAFEENTVELWSAVRQCVSDFLTDLWHAGALVGERPEEAFFVRCGLNESMSQNDVDNGRLIVLLGFAPVMAGTPMKVVIPPLSVRPAPTL